MDYTDKQKERLNQSKRVLHFYSKEKGNKSKRSTLEELKERKRNRGSKSKNNE